MTGKGIIDVHPGSSFYITIANLANSMFSFQKTKRLVKIPNVPSKIVHIRDDRLLYYSGTHVNKSESPVKLVQYKPTPDRQKQGWQNTKPANRRRRKNSKQIDVRTLSYPPSSRHTDKPFLNDRGIRGHVRRACRAYYRAQTPS